MGKLTQCDYLKGELISFNKQKEKLIQKVKLFCQNKEYSLNERWNLFIDSDLGEHNNWCEAFETIEIENLNDFNKYELVKVSGLIDLYFDYLSDDLYNSLNITCNYETDEYNFFIENHVNPKVNIFKEEILEKFIKSFEYNW